MNDINTILLETDLKLAEWKQREDFNDKKRQLKRECDKAEFDFIFKVDELIQNFKKEHNIED